MSRAEELTVVPVSERTTPSSWWLTLGKRVVLVSPHVTAPSNVLRDAHKVINALSYLGKQSHPRSGGDGK